MNNRQDDHVRDGLNQPISLNLSAERSCALRLEIAPAASTHRMLVKSTIVELEQVVLVEVWDKGPDLSFVEVVVKSEMVVGSGCKHPKRRLCHWFGH